MPKLSILSNIVDPKSLSPFDRLVYWIVERHRIYILKKGGAKPPWTPDPILQRFFFTNPYRENDKVTVWIRKNIRERFEHNKNLWFMLCIARQFNLPDSLQELMDGGAWPAGNEWNATLAAKILNARQKRGLSIYTGAYMIRAESDPKKPWYNWTKQEYMTKIVLGRPWEKRLEAEGLLGCSLEGACEWLKQFHGWGGFMSYEVVSDLRHTRYLRDAPDILTWANPGPGAQRGLNWLYERPIKKPVPYAQAIAEMRELLGRINERLPSSMPQFEMRDVEHGLCECDKYNRLLFGTGRSKRLYNGRGN